MFHKLLLSVAALTLAACGAETTSANQASKTDANEAQAPKQDITTQDLGNGFYMLLGPGHYRCAHSLRY